MLHAYSRNIYCLYLLKLAKWLMLIMPIVALFYKANGLDEFDIYVLQAIYSLSVAILEIPSGYMADIMGRKKTLVLGSILGAAGYGIYSVSYSLPGFVLAEITLGVGGSLISGADSAMLYDSLVALRKKHRYLQLEGRITSLGNFAETIAAICGGVLAAFLSYRVVYGAQTIVAALAIPAAILLKEPERQKVIFRPGIRHILLVCHDSLLGNRKLSAAILLSAATGIATLCMAWTCQLYFVNIGFTETLITPLWITLNLVVGLTAAYASRIKSSLGKRASLLLIIFYIPLSYICMGILPTIPAIVILYLFYAVRGYATPVLKDLINSHCESATRATVLSVRSLIIRFGFALLGPALGKISAASTFSVSLVFAGIILLIFSVFAGWRLYRSLPECFTIDS